jgi:inner membrane protein COX18
LAILASAGRRAGHLPERALAPAFWSSKCRYQYSNLISTVFRPSHSSTRECSGQLHAGIKTDAFDLTKRTSAQLGTATMPLLFRPSPLRSSCSTRQLSKLFFQLPPSCRSFHASPRPQSVVLVAHDALTSLHSFTGLPWAYTIPLFALTLRATLILPISIYQRRVSQRQASLVPIIQAWSQSLRHETMREVGHLGPVVAQSTLVRKLRKKRSEIYERWGCGLWKNYLGLVQVPVFLVTMEALRAMAGAHQGWWGMITGSWRGDVGAATETTLTAEGLTGAALIPVETSFATEGALWFPNLLLADPQLLLPFMLSGAILLNLFGHKPVPLGKWQTRLRRSMGIVALAVGPMMIHIPSALVLYWVSSSLLAYGQSLLLEIVMPIKKPITLCKPKRPMRSGLGIPEKQAP